MSPFNLKAADLKREIEIIARKVTRWSYDNLPPGIRTVVGILFFIGGCFGFLPILGFWMIPVGVMLIMLDLPFLRHHVIDWMNKDDDIRPSDAKSAVQDKTNKPS